MTSQLNPFLERMSERTTSDLDFVRLFSPKILERLPKDAFEHGIHIFRSPPGAGKTTLLRAFTPSALRSFWYSRKTNDEVSEACQRLASLGVLEDQEKPQFLGVLLTCASGYADLPPGTTIKNEGLFRALFDCRIVLRTLRSLSTLVGNNSSDVLKNIKIEYPIDTIDFKGIPNFDSAEELARWAEEYERKVYRRLDDFIDDDDVDAPAHYQFEGVLWLQMVRFKIGACEIGNKRLLMVDDLHKLRKRQRAQLIDELTIQRPNIPVWLAERTIAIGTELLSQGAREGREIKTYGLEDMWGGSKNTFALNILERRMIMQDQVSARSFQQCIQEDIVNDSINTNIQKGIDNIKNFLSGYQGGGRYEEWLTQANGLISAPNFSNLIDLYSLRILIARDESKRQLTLGLTLTPEELDERSNSQVRAAAEIFIHNEIKIPYYYGMDKICVLSTNNVEELLSIASALYENMKHKQILRSSDPTLSPSEQEKIIKEVAEKKRNFIPKSHSEGSRAQRLLDAIGLFCRDKTFQKNAPYAPGVTGVRLSNSELGIIFKKGGTSVVLRQIEVLSRVLAECAAENLLIAKPSSATPGRDGGTVFYLNRLLCAYYDLPLQLGGWQDVKAVELAEWMEKGYQNKRRRLEIE